MLTLQHLDESQNDLTRGGVGVLLCPNFVILGNFDPLVGLYTGLTQPFSTLHTKAYSPSIVFATCANLGKKIQTGIRSGHSLCRISAGLDMAPVCSTPPPTAFLMVN